VRHDGTASTACYARASGDECHREPGAAPLARRLLPPQIAVGLSSMVLWAPVEKLFMTQIGFTPRTVAIRRPRTPRSSRCWRSRPGSLPTAGAAAGSWCAPASRCWWARCWGP